MSPWLPDVRPGADAAGASHSEPPAVRRQAGISSVWSVVGVVASNWSLVVTGHPRWALGLQRGARQTTCLRWRLFILCIIIGDVHGTPLVPVADRALQRSARP